MKSDVASRKKSGSVLLSLLPLVVLGGAFGYLLAGDVSTASVRHMISSLSLGLVGAFIVLLWLDLVVEFVSLKRDPAPEALDLADRAAVKEKMESLGVRTSASARVRHLFKSWSLGCHPRQVIGLAGFQSAQARSQLFTGSMVALFLLLASLGRQGGLQWTMGGLLALGMSIFARQSFLSSVDRYIECRILARLPAHIPQTAMTATELADALGTSIQSAFKNYVPQVDQMASAMRTAVEGAMQNVAASVDKLQKSVSEGQGAMAATSADLKSGLTSGTEQWKAVLQNHTQSLDKSLAAVPEQLARTYGEGAGQIVAAFKEHADKISAASQGLQAQLDRIAQLGKDIEKVLHVQQSVDDTLKAVSTSEEFRKTLETLNRHVEASDALLREAARPKTIRLVESDGDVAQG